MTSKPIPAMDFQAAGACLLQFSLPTRPLEPEKAAIQQELQCLLPTKSGGETPSESQVQQGEGTAAAAAAEEECGRERLKRHRREVAGRVWIPEIWGQEELLKDWIDCSAFDSCLFPAGIGSARAALIEEGRRANNGGFRLENRC